MPLKIEEMTKQAAKSPDESAVTMTQLILPEHTNALGTAFGGTIMAWIDVACAIAAGKHAREQVVTASVDALHFLNPGKLGHVVHITATVNHAFKTSMEVGVRADAEDMKTGCRTHLVSAYLTFVALDQAGKPIPVPGLKPGTEIEKQRAENAVIRKESRVKLAKDLKAAALD